MQIFSVKALLSNLYSVASQQGSKDYSVAFTVFLIFSWFLSHLQLLSDHWIMVKILFILYFEPLDHALE